MRGKMILAGVVCLLLAGALALTLWITQQQQELRSKAVNDVEFMLVTAPIRKKHHKSQLGVVLSKLDQKFKYRLVFTLNYTQNGSGSSSNFHPRNTKKTVKVHENKTYKFKFRTPPSCDWTANLDIQLFYRERKHVWQPVNAATAKGNSRQTIDCNNNIIEEDAPPADESSLAEPEDDASEIESLEDPSVMDGESAAAATEAEPTSQPTSPPTAVPSATRVPTTQPTSTHTAAPTTTGTASNPSPTSRIDNTQHESGQSGTQSFVPTNTPTQLANNGAVPTQTQSPFQQHSPTSPPAGGPIATPAPAQNTQAPAVTQPPVNNNPTAPPGNNNTSGLAGLFMNIGGAIVNNIGPTRSAGAGFLTKSPTPGQSENQPEPTTFSLPTLIPTRTQYLVDTSNAAVGAAADAPPPNAIAHVDNQSDKAPSLLSVETLTSPAAKVAGGAVAGGLGIFFVISKIRELLLRPKGPVLHPETPMQEPPREGTNYP